MNTMYLSNEIDGYIDDKPYKIREFEKDFNGDRNIEFSFDDLKQVKEFDSLHKWVWLFMREYSNSSCDGGLPMFLFHVTPIQIAEVLGVDVFDVDSALNELIQYGLIEKYDINGMYNIYAVKESIFLV